jgi:hypothetical protein
MARDKVTTKKTGPKKATASVNELILKIDAFTPSTFPMARLAQYVEKFAALVGNDANVHLLSVDGGSCKLRAFADEPAIPKIHDRVNRVIDGTAPRSALRAHSELDDFLAADNAVGEIALGGNKVIEFPGRRRRPTEEIGPVRRTSSIDGHIYSIDGKDETINIHLKDGDSETRCIVSITLARRLTPYLLMPQKVRLAGSGQWYRQDGHWHMRSFTAEDFIPLNESTLAESLGRLRASFSDVDPGEFMEAMSDLRNDSA